MEIFHEDSSHLYSKKTVERHHIMDMQHRFKKTRLHLSYPFIHQKVKYRMQFITKLFTEPIV